MERLDVRGLNNLVQIVDNEQMQTDSFHKIRILVVDDCEKLINIASSDQIKMFNNLEYLEVSNCRTLEVVFDFKGLKVNQEHAEIALGQQRLLNLKDLPKLTHVWRMVPKGIHGLQNLRSLEVERCDNLRYLLSISTAKLLVKLQQLHLKRCKMMEEVIETEKEEEGAKEMMLFPELDSITLYALKNLESFVSGSYTSKWNSLKTLHVADCPKFKAFHLESPSVQKVKTIDVTKSEKQQESNFYTATLKHIFNEKVAFPSLESLQLSGMMNLDVIWHGQLPYARFGKLRVISVFKCDKLLSVISSKNLRSLVIEECASPSPLNSLPSLRNLEMLIIEKCASLLEVFEFKGGQETEDAHSVKLQINSDCPPKPVHVEAGEERIDKIVFPKLTALILQDLENLSIFCYGNYDFEFPSLEYVTFEECPKMRTFCSGQLSAPKLTQVHTDYKGSGVWNGDLNSTIQHLSQKSLQKLEIKNSLASSPSIEDASNEEDA